MTNSNSNNMSMSENDHSVADKEYEAAVAKIVFYVTKDHPDINKIDITGQTKRIIEASKPWYSPEEINGLSRAIEDWKINPVTPQELNEDSINKSIAQAMEQYNQNPSISSRYNIENLVEYAEEKKLKIPNSQMEKMRIALEEKKETGESLKIFVDRIAEKHGQKDMRWYRAEEPQDNKALLKYQDNRDITYAIIVERVRHDNKEKFYAAYRINENSKAIPLKTSGSIEVLKNNIGAYFTGITINEVTVERLKEYAKSKNVNVSHETAQRWEKLIASGENKETIITHIDSYASKKGGNFEKNDKAPGKEIGMDI